MLFVTLHLSIVKVVAFGVIAGALAIANVSEAGQSETADSSTIVLISFESQRPVADEVVAALKSQLAQLPVSLRVEWKDAPEATVRDQIALAAELGEVSSIVAVVWYEHHSDGEGFLYLAGRDKQRLLLRHLAAGDGVARSETVALVTYAAVEVILRGGEVGMVEPPASAVKPTPAPEPVSQPDEQIKAPPTGGRLGFDLGAAALVCSTEQPLNIGLDLGIYVAPLPDFEIFAGYTFWNIRYIEGENALIRIVRHPILVGLEYGWWRGMVRLGGRLGVNFDRVTQQTKRVLSDAPDAVGMSNDDWIISAIPEISLLVSVASRFMLFARLGAEIPMNRVEYVYQAIEGNEVIESQWPVQIRLALGLKIRVH